MCLIVFAVNAHPDYRLILAANRDEFYDRPSAIADYWEDQSQILGGRDLQAKGTWMALDKKGRFAAVTNYRDLKNIRQDVKSRGDLPLDYLLDSISSEEYLSRLSQAAGDYNGFNLLLYDGECMNHYSNYEGKINRIPSGIHGVSNSLLDTPWPKVTKLKDEFSKEISSDFSHENLLTLLENDGLAEDSELPDTGVPYDLEKMLSAICIKSEKYGTCCSSVLTISNAGEVQFTERSFAVGNRKEGVVTYEFKL